MAFDSDGKYYKTDKATRERELATRLNDKFDRDIDTTPDSVFTSIVVAWTDYEHDHIEERLKEVYDAGFIDTAEGEQLERVVGDFGIQRIAASKATGWVQLTRENPADKTYGIQSGTTIQTDSNDPVAYKTTEYVEMAEGTSYVNVDVQAVEGGPEGNIAANTQLVLPSPPKGVTGVKNPEPIGDPDYTDTSGNVLIAGESEESDPELRDRAKRIITQGGAATVDAILASVLANEDVPGVESALIFNNRGNSADADGLPGGSFELVVYGGDADDIAQAMFDTVSVCDRMVSGYHGTAVIKTVQSSINNQNFEVQFSRPAETNVDMTLEFVHNESYIGDSALRDRIVEYIGGTDSDGETHLGLDIGQDVYIDQLEDIIVGPEETGVIGISTLTTTPAQTTDANGLDIIDIPIENVARTDATDGSIGITKTSQ